MAGTKIKNDGVAVIYTINGLGNRSHEKDRRSGKDVRELKKYIVGIVGVLFLAGFDQITKYLAMNHLKHSDGIEILPGIFRLEYLENHGAAFGILQEQRILLLIFTGLIFFFLSLLYYKIPMQLRYIPMLAVLVLLLSGAVGNLIDRIFHSYVVDFFYFSLIDFPIFNVADCYVVVGVGLALLLLLFYYREDDFSFMDRHLSEEK